MKKRQIKKVEIKQETKEDMKARADKFAQET